MNDCRNSRKKFFRELIKYDVYIDKFVCMHYLTNVSSHYLKILNIAVLTLFKTSQHRRGETFKVS